jgi:DNA segregation ATPase FtsK/SpoIIIE, S-DNA-T family
MTRRSRPVVAPSFPPLYIGRDEWGSDRYLSLPGLTGITCGGLPGYGKTSLILSWLCQLAGSAAVQLVFIDGKGGTNFGDYSAWYDRAWISVGDDLAAAADAFERVHTLMHDRAAVVRDITGSRNAWHRGPTPEFPLIITVVDECHTFLDLDGRKNDRQAENHVRSIRHLGGQLTRKGRNVLMLTIWITQKQTGDAIPTAIRDNCGFGLSFACKNADVAVAALGDDIRKYPSYCPTGLQDLTTYTGVCTAALRTGADPYVRLRVPEISEDVADARARATAHLRRDPAIPLHLVPPQHDAA